MSASAVNLPHPQSPPVLIAGCLLASVLLHLLVALGLPGWHRPAADVPAAVLDVVLLPEMTPSSAPQAPSPAAAPKKAAPTAQRPPVLALPAAPERAPAAFTAPPAESAPVVPAESARQSAPSPSAPSAQSAPARADAAVTPPSFSAAYLRNPPPRYPPAARRNGDEGTVLLRVLVAADGAAVKVELDRSSGSTLLDTAALDAVRVWRFVPARRGQQAIEDWVRVPLTFRLES